jgi:hypothetical protein
MHTIKGAKDSFWIFNFRGLPYTTAFAPDQKYVIGYWQVEIFFIYTVSFSNIYFSALSNSRQDLIYYKLTNH